MLVCVLDGLMYYHALQMQLIMEYRMELAVLQRDLAIAKLAKCK